MLCGRDGIAGGTCRKCRVPLPTPNDEPAVREVTCARCRDRMLAIGVDTNAVLHVCRRCRGMFVPPLAWHVLLTRPDRVAKLEASLPPAPAAASTTLASVRCPACAREMERVRFANASEVVVDTCGSRHGVWLDAGELGAVSRFNRHREDVGTSFVRMQAEARDPMDRMRRIAEQHVPADVLRRTAEALPPPPPPPWWRTTTGRVAIVAAVIGIQIGVVRCSRSGETVRESQSLVKQAGPSAAGELGR